MPHSIIIGTAGHIDHGKSALVRALTGTDPDRLKEEKARGITIELGFAHYVAGDVTYAFVDVPGHERFVKNMLAGASGVDAVLLVIAADESVMPQTREHFDICRLLGVGHGVVALTKSDLVDDETVELVRLETRELVDGSFLEAAPVVPVSARTGHGLDELRLALADAASQARRRPAVGAARVPIDRAFSMKGFGTVVTGTVASGRVALDAELRLMPGDRPVKIRGIQVHGSAAEQAIAGQRAAVNLGGVDLDQVARGETLATPGSLRPTRRFDATLDLLADARPLKHGARVRFHQGTAEIMGRVAVSLADTRRPDAGPREPAASAVEPGARAYVRIRLEAPAVLTRGDRYILRAYSPSVTIAGGGILDPAPPRGGTRTPATRRRFRALDGGDDEAVRLMIDEAGPAGLALDALTWRAGVVPERVGDVVERMTAAEAAIRVEDRLVAPDVLEALAARLLEELARHHQREPLSEGLAREEGRERLFGRTGPAVFEHVLARLTGEGRIVARDRIALATHQLSLSDEEARARDAIEDEIRRCGLTPPDTVRLREVAGGDAALADRMVQLLVRQKTLVRVDSLIFHAETLERLKKEVRALEGDPPTVDVPAFKRRYSVTRKYAIPLLEFLDRERVTRRVGERRIVVR